MALQPAPHRFTVAEYHRMGEAGIFAEDDRVELIDGEVVEITPIGSRHAAVVMRLNRLLDEAVGERAIVSPQNPVELSDYSEPQPDLALLRPPSDFYAGGHPRPSDTLLIIEVADTTVAYDRRVKLPLYAAAGVPEVWIVDLPAATLEVHTGPLPGGYGASRRLTAAHTVSPTALSDVVLAVSEVLGPLA
jgi:Uma2 family endonuclease